jgi:16S rRNA (cytidine1402-2'-O)-methyltransferase
MRDASRKDSWQAGLYVVSTPIGNARDITLRALDALKAANLIACEDTRVTRRLLSMYDIDTPTIAYHEHNAEKVRPGLIRRLQDGEMVALVSDAGTPTISDPGYRLVREAREAGCRVEALPGASAVLTALAAAGLPTDRFLFVGFLPPKEAGRRRALEEVADIRATLVFYEATSRLPRMLADLAEVLGPREAAVGRELTKLHEEMRLGTLSELAAHYAAAGPPKGEAVVLVRAAEAPAMAGDEDLDVMLRSALRGASLKDAVAEVTRQSGRPRREVYARALALERE